MVKLAKILADVDYYVAYFYYEEYFRTAKAKLREISLGCALSSYSNYAQIGDENNTKKQRNC